MQTIFIGGTVYGHSADAHLLACPDDTQGDLPPVSNEYLFKHPDGTD
jgi:hypothetical protein